MKKMLFLILTCLSVSVAAQERSANSMSDAAWLGVTSGSALACNAGSKLDDFELIAARYIANTAQTEAEERKGYRDFATYKFRAYQEQRKSPQMTCAEILDSFEHLPIFKTIVYADGSLKTPEGKMLKAKRPVKKTTTASKTKTTKKTTKKKK